MDCGYTPKQFVGLFDVANADRQISRLFASVFGPLRTTRRASQGCTASIKGSYPTSTGHLGLVTGLTRTMEAVVNFVQLSGIENETVVNELSVAGRNVLETFQIQSPYAMRTHGDSENGLNWDGGHIPYNQLSSVLNEAVAGFAHLYAYGDCKLHLFHNC